MYQLSLVCYALSQVVVQNGFDLQDSLAPSAFVNNMFNGLKKFADDVDKKLPTIIPSGVIFVWSGTKENIPDGFALCDGENGTPNLSGRFVLGPSDTHIVGQTDGEETHILTVDEMPSHNHGVSYGSKSGGGPSSSLWGDLTEGNFNTTLVGGNQAHNNMPPYYVLCYIMKL